MFFSSSRRSSRPLEDPAFSPGHDQPFDRNDFGRMDYPTTSAFDHRDSSSIHEQGVPGPYRRESLAPSSLNDDPFALDSTVTFSTTSQYTCPPSHSHHEESFEMHDLKQQQQQELSIPPIRKQSLYDCAALPGEITPYLGLRARLSQVPINRWTVLLLLVLVRMLILFAQLNTNLVSAQQEATAACSKVEDIGSTLASMPHYLSAGVNKLVAGGVTDTVRGLVKLLIMIVNAVMQTIMFFINFEYGTIACVADDFIHGLITVASDTIGALLKELSEGLKDIANGLSSAVSGVDDAIKGIENTVNSIPFAPHIDWPDLDALDSGIASLKNYQGIDANQTVAAINRFNQTVPDFDQLETDVQSVINIPFKAVELLLNESIGNWTMDPSVFPTASKQTLTFCTGNDVLTQFFEALFTVVKDAKTIAIVSLILAAILAAVVMAWWEVKRYHRSVAMAQTTLHRREPMDIVYIASRPLTARTGLWIAEKVSADPRRQMLIRWCIAYATTYTALFVLSLAVAGALSVLCQFLVMRAVQKEAPALTQVGGFVTEVIDRLEGISTSWANESNQAIASFQDDINGKVLVYVSNATDAVVNVINVFENKTEQILGEALGTVPQLENFANGLLDCILIDKLDEVKDGMEWIHQHAQVSFPAFPTDIFSLGITANSSSAGDNSSVFSLLASSGNNTADDITGAVDKVVTALRTSIITEGLIALVLMLIYIAYVFFAVAQAALRMCFVRERLSPSGIDRTPSSMGNRQGQLHSSNDETRRSSSTLRSLPHRGSSIPKLSEVTVLGDNSERAGDTYGKPKGLAGSRHVEVQSILSDEDPFGDDVYAVDKKKRDNREHAHVNHGSKDREEINLTPRRGHFFKEDGDG